MGEEREGTQVISGSVKCDLSTGCRPGCCRQGTVKELPQPLGIPGRPGAPPPTAPALLP